MTRPVIPSISQLFIVSDMAATLSFYRDRLGFTVTFQEPPPDDCFAIVPAMGRRSCSRTWESNRFPTASENRRPDGMPILMCLIRMRWRQSSLHEVSPSPCLSRTLRIV